MKKNILQFLGILLAWLLVYPLITIADRKGLYLGVPVLYWYVFGVWILVIIVVALVINSKRFK